jgi:hypothetical protein
MPAVTCIVTILCTTPPVADVPPLLPAAPGPLPAPVPQLLPAPAISERPTADIPSLWPASLPLSPPPAQPPLIRPLPVPDGSLPAPLLPVLPLLPPPLPDEKSLHLPRRRLAPTPAIVCVTAVLHMPSLAMLLSLTSSSSPFVSMATLPPLSIRPVPMPRALPSPVIISQSPAARIQLAIIAAALPSLLLLSAKPVPVPPTLLQLLQSPPPGQALYLRLPPKPDNPHPTSGEDFFYLPGEGSALMLTCVP